MFHGMFCAQKKKYLICTQKHILTHLKDNGRHDKILNTMIDLQLIGVDLEVIRRQFGAR